MKRYINCLIAATAMAFLLGSVSLIAKTPENYSTHVYPDTVIFEPGPDQVFEFDVDLIVKGPDGYYEREHFPAGSLIELSPDSFGDQPMSDGTYDYEIRVMGRETQLERNSHTEQLPLSSNDAAPQSGTVTLKDGSFVNPDEQETREKSKMPDMGLEVDDADDDGSRDFNINDDLIVIGSACIGFDCVNGESFSFDTIRLKENNLRIKFEDTSTSSSFPTTDWELVANDSANGGRNRFSITDADAAREIFTVEANAPNNALYVESSGEVGFGTSNPVVELHTASGDTPTLRLEQDGSNGFQPQSWDIAGNETSFFVRDATNGSTLPFRVFPSSPSNSLVVRDGDVGVSNISPDAALHVQDDATWPDPLMIIENSLASPAASNNLELRSNQVPVLSFVDTDPSAGNPENWNLSMREDGEFRITNPVGSGVEFGLDTNGNLEISGDLTANGTTYASSRALKENFSQIDYHEILIALDQLPITRWNYKRDDNSLQHIGPVAEDFNRLFNLSHNKPDKISATDINGVALASIKALNNKLDAKQTEIESLNKRVQQLESAIQDIKHQR